MKYSFLLLFISITSLKAQNYELPKYQLSISYFGEMLTHKGIRVGITKPFAQSIKEKGEAHIVNKSWVGGSYLTYYRHRRNHKGLLFTGAIGRQRIGKKGFQTAINFETGYMLSVLDGEVFSWDGEQFEEGKKGSSHLIFGLNGGFGWNFKKTTDLPISFMIQPHFYFQAPYNTTIAQRVALEVKLAYNLK